MTIPKLYRVYYAETMEYEDYIEAPDEESAKEIFKSTLGDDVLEPIVQEVVEFVAEEVPDEQLCGSVHTHKDVKKLLF